jgi:hypothetical protein
MTRDPLMVSSRQRTAIVLRLGDVLGVTEHDPRTWVLSELLGRDVKTTNDLDEDEYYKVRGMLNDLEDSPLAAVLVSKALELAFGTTGPEGSSLATEKDLGGNGGDLA